MKPLVVVTVAMAVVLIGAAVWFFAGASTGAVRISIDAASGAKFRGCCEVDGAKHDLAGTLGVGPTRFEFEGHRASWWVLPEDGSPSLAIDVHLDGKHGNASSQVGRGFPPSGAHGWVVFETLRPQFWTESLDPRRAESEWMVAPR